MKIFAALLCLLLLTGCGPSNVTPSEPLPVPAVCLRISDHALAQQTGGIAEVFSPGAADRLTSFGTGLLLSGSDALTLYTGEDLTEAARSSEGAILGNDHGRLYVYDAPTRQIQILDPGLQLLDTLSLPRDCLGTPGISADGTQVCYLKEDGLYLWDTCDGCTRVLRSNLEVQDGSVHFLGETLLLRLTAPDGQPQTQLLSLKDGGQRYPDLCPREAALFGDTLAVVSTSGAFSRILLLSDSPQRLTTGAGESFLGFLAEDSWVFTGENTAQGLLLRLYDLDANQYLGSLCLPDTADAWDFCRTSEGRLFFLARSRSETLLLQWHYDAFPPQSRTGILLPCYDSPSMEERQRSAAKAARLEAQYGITLRLYEDAAQAMPWDYSLAPSAAADETDWTLEALDSLLALLPEDFMPRLSRGWEGFSLCLVDSIQGTAASGSLDHAQGLQFREGNQYYVALVNAPVEELRYTLFHELSHLIDTQVMGSCSAYDNWQDLNPQGFAYSLDGITQASQYSAYLTGTNRCFVDDYAMTSPSEDRARIFECAVNPGNADLFTPPLMQQKLRRICAGIRKSFDLEEAPESFLWEQYLVQYGREASGDL